MRVKFHLRRTRSLMLNKDRRIFQMTRKMLQKLSTYQMIPKKIRAKVKRSRAKRLTLPCPGASMEWIRSNLSVKLLIRETRSTSRSLALWIIPPSKCSKETKNPRYSPQPREIPTLVFGVRDRATWSSRPIKMRIKSQWAVPTSTSRPTRRSRQKSSATRATIAHCAWTKLTGPRRQVIYRRRTSSTMGSGAMTAAAPNTIPRNSTLTSYFKTWSSPSERAS